MCGRRLHFIPFPQTESLRIEAAPYSGVDSRVARTKRNKEMRRKRVFRRLRETEDESVYDNPSIYVLDDRAVKEWGGENSGCLLMSRKRPRRRWPNFQGKKYEQKSWTQKWRRSDGDSFHCVLGSRGVRRTLGLDKKFSKSCRIVPNALGLRERLKIAYLWSSKRDLERTTRSAHGLYAMATVQSPEWITITMKFHQTARLLLVQWWRKSP